MWMDYVELEISAGLVEPSQKIDEWALKQGPDTAVSVQSNLTMILFFVSLLIIRFGLQFCTLLCRHLRPFRLHFANVAVSDGQTVLPPASSMLRGVIYHVEKGGNTRSWHWMDNGSWQYRPARHLASAHYRTFPSNPRDFMKIFKAKTDLSYGNWKKPLFTGLLARIEWWTAMQTYFSNFEYFLSASRSRGNQCGILVLHNIKCDNKRYPSHFSRPSIVRYDRRSDPYAVMRRVQYAFHH